MVVYTIVVLTSGDKYKKDVLIQDFRPRDLNNKAIPETRHKIVHLCPKYVTKDTKEPYKQWLKIIDDSLDKKIDKEDYDNEIFQEIITTIEEDNIDPVEKARMIDEYSNEEYLKDEKEKEEQKAKQEGIKEGLEKGIEKGIETEKIEIAKNLLDVLDIETISLKTELSLEEIEELKKGCKM
jgi:predicted transposase/invertase (TIGR01784 family)